jgi:hypothetical protein
MKEAQGAGGGFTDSLCVVGAVPEERQLLVEASFTWLGEQDASQRRTHAVSPPPLA